MSTQSRRVFLGTALAAGALTAGCAKAKPKVKLPEFRDRYGKDAIILFVVHENNTFDVFTDDLKLKEGDKLISLVFENDSSKPSTQAESTGSKEKLKSSSYQINSPENS